MRKMDVGNLKTPEKIGVDEYIDLYSDPFSEVTKKNRKSLFTFSILAVFFGYLDIKPSKIPSLGITEIPEIANSFLPAFLILAIVFQIIAFSIHAYNDWFWNRVRKEAFEKANYYSNQYDKLTAEINAHKLLETITSKTSNTSESSSEISIPPELSEKIDNLQISGFEDIVTKQSKKVGNLMATLRLSTDLIAPIGFGFVGLMILMPKLFT